MDLERRLPDRVAGRDLALWSVRGESVVRCLTHGSDQDLAAFRDASEAAGVSIDDYMIAIGGRSDVDTDPPYLVFAYRLAGHKAADAFPRAMGLDHPGSKPWRTLTIGGKRVLVGDESMLDQTPQVRGRPYVWNSGEVHYLIVTAEASWANEVLSHLK
jgi:hypothetical protein